MTENKYPQIISDREVREWIPSCPIRIKAVRLVRTAEGTAPKIEISSALCTRLDSPSFTAAIEYKNEHRERVGEAREARFACGKSELTDTFEYRAVYADVTVQSVMSGDATVWTNESGERGKLPPEQGIIWQTDPLCAQMKRECAGVTQAKYIPDTIDGAWRCTCGGINLTDAPECMECGCPREWLTAHFDREYLEAENARLEAVSTKNAKRKKKRASVKIPSGVKVGLALAAALAAIALIVLTFTYFIPESRLSRAQSLAEQGEYDRAIEIFTELGGYSNAEKLLADTVYKKAQSMTGIDDVVIADSVSEPWFSVTDEGELSFDRNTYTGSWEHITVPDVFDGVIVKKLARNCFINCDELKSVKISSCTEELGEQAFYNCKALAQIDFGTGVRVITQRAFINCTSLEYVELPESVESVGVRAFNNCTALKIVVLGKGITEISSYQFSYCTSLTELILFSPLTEIGENAFAECVSLEKLHCKFSEYMWIEPETAEGNDAFSIAVKLFEQ